MKRTDQLNYPGFLHSKLFKVGAVILTAILLSIVAFVIVPAHNLQNKLRRLETVIADVKSGRLKPDACGVVTLPESMASLTVDGRIYVVVDEHKN